MSDKILKYGVVGMIRGASVASNGIKNPKCRLTAVCDKNPETLERGINMLKTLGHDGNFEKFTDYDEMLRSDIDAVIVATEATNHVNAVIKALEAGKHVLSEIPSFDTVDEAHKLKAAVKAHPELKYMAAENCCYWAFIQTWKKMHEDGQFGDIVYAEGEYLHPDDPDKYGPDVYPKGHWRTTYPSTKYMTHEIGPLLYIMNDRCVSVSCIESDIRPNPYLPEKTLSGVAIMKTEKGAMIRILIMHSAYTTPTHNYRVCGTLGSIENSRLVNVYDAHSYANLYSIPGTFNSKIDIPVTTKYEGISNAGHGGGDYMMFADFVDTVLEDREPQLNVDFAIQMSLPGILAHESAINGGKVIEIPKI